MKDVDKNVLSFIQSYVDEHGYAPTYEEIRTGMGFSTHWRVSECLGRLKQAGYLATDHPGSSRALRIV